MSDHPLDVLAEITGTIKGFVTVFESQLGEVMSTQRLASTEMNHALAETQRALKKLLDHAEAAAAKTRQMQEELRDKWQFHIEKNSKEAGRAMALEFGQQVSTGLRKDLEVLAQDVQAATRRFEWMTTLKWGLGIGLGMALTLLIGIPVLVQALSPSVRGLSSEQVQGVLSYVSTCPVGQKTHVCVAVDDKPLFSQGAHGESVVIKGM
jgi:hypothetical protein